MVDYEVVGYYVEFSRHREVAVFTENFDCEEDAIDFIEKNRHNWDEYRLVQMRVAIF